MLPEDVEEPSEALAQVQAMIGEFRRSLVLVPVREGGVLIGDQGGVRWIYYHGHTRSWDELSPQMQAALRKEGMVNKKGKILPWEE